MAKGLAKQYFNSLNNTSGKSSGPEDKFGFNLLIAATTLCDSLLLLPALSSTRDIGHEACLYIHDISTVHSGQLDLLYIFP